MSLLSKKSWHARSNKNQAKVREAEEAAAEEAKRVEQRRRELQEERELEALRRLQGKSARDDHSTTLDWMYKTPVELKDDKVQDEYLLGKRMPEQKTDNVITQVQQAPGSLFVKTAPAATNLADMKAKLRDDPLMLIKAREAEHMRSMSATQAQLHRIREQELDDDHRRHRERDERRDSSKDKHKHKHKDKHHRHKRHHSDSDEDDSRRHKKRRREEEMETASHSKQPKLEEGSRPSSSAPGLRHDDRSRERHYEERRHQEEDMKEERQWRGEPSRGDFDTRRSSYGAESTYGRSDRHGYERDGRQYDLHRRDRDEMPHESSRHAPSRYEAPPTGHPYPETRTPGRQPPYSSHNQAPSNPPSSYRQYDRRQGRAALPEMTDEERDRMLAQMQRGAKQLQETRSVMMDERKAESVREREEYLQRGAALAETGTGLGMPSFVADMNQEALRSTSMQDNVSRSRFYLQRGD